jgi:hypothetical protein
MKDAEVEGPNVSKKTSTSHTEIQIQRGPTLRHFLDQSEGKVARTGAQNDQVDRLRGTHTKQLSMRCTIDKFKTANEKSAGV